MSELVSSVKRLWPALLVAAAVVAGIPGGAAAVTGPRDSIVVLHTNDLHSHLDPVAGERLGGAAARAALLARQRALGGATLTIDAGDVFQGTPYYNFFR